MEGNATLERATRLFELADIAAAEEVARLLEQGGGRLGVWGAALRLPGVVAIRWATLAEQAAHMAELAADVRDDGFAGTRRVRTAEGFKVTVRR